MNIKRAVIYALAGMGSLSAAHAQRAGEWPEYARDKAASRYALLSQINARNFKSLKVAWRWSSPDNEFRKKNPAAGNGPNEATPLMVGGVLYTSTGLNMAAAINALTGETLWTYDPGTGGGVHRGLAYWESGSERRLFLATSKATLIAIDARSGKRIATFGENGEVDLTKGLRRPVERGLVGNTSPPIVCRDVVVIGGAVDDFQDKKEMPPGDVRGFDARTGKLLWTFHTVPQEGEPGNETWKEGSWKYTGNTNVWTLMSADEELGYVYLPVSTPTNDWYGGHRPGNGLFGDSLVCLEARTGRRVWHFQLVHHGLWDYDPPCAPNLIDVKIAGRKVKAVVQVTKQAFAYAFDRETGTPLWPIEERPVAPTTVPGDTASPTQPFPTKPAPFDRQGLSKDDIIDHTPELRKASEEILAGYHYGPLYMPPKEGKTILMPGWVGGASWAGAAVDPETGILYVPSQTNPMWLELRKPASPNANVRFYNAANRIEMEGPRGMPLLKGPHGRVTAIDMNRGDHLWMTPIGEGERNHPAVKHLNLPPQGLSRRVYVLVTKTLVIAAQEGSWFNDGNVKEPPCLRALDKKTGKIIAEVPLPKHATGAPMTYMAGGKQYIAVPVGGATTDAEIIAVSIPK
jgi:quinoprotein glucose dehydrogenase